MKLNICMLLFFDYKENMLIYSQIEICTYLRYFGHRITWVLWGDKNQRVQPFSFKGIDVYTTPQVTYFPGNSRLATVLNLMPNALRRMYLIFKILRKGRYDIVTAADFAYDGLVAAYFKKRYKTPFVFQLQNPLEQYRLGYQVDSTRPQFWFSLVARAHEFLVSRLLYKADLILPISNGLKQHLIKQGIPESKIVPCPSGVDINLFGGNRGIQVRTKYHLQDDKIIVYVGSLGRPRLLSVLIQAFALAVTGVSVKLLMVGEGNDEDNLKRLVNDLYIGNHVVFTGQVPQTEVPDFIAAADIAVSPVPPLPFYKMSSPIKLFEYMAMAKPVIANEEIPEQKEVLEESGGGILVPFDPKALAGAMAKLLGNPELAAEMGRRGREWVFRNRSYQVLARQVEKRYFELIQGK